MRSVFLRLVTDARSMGARRAFSPPRFVSDGSHATFFGYHDKIPFSVDGQRLLAMSVVADDAHVDSECTAMQLGYFSLGLDGASSKFVRLTTTRTWCWQQGCMLQWNPASAEQQIVFNSLTDDAYCSVLFDCLNRKIIRQWSEPIYAIDATGRFASTLNFSRLNRLSPGYGYRALPDRTLGDDAPDGDGLFLLDLHLDTKKLLVSLSELASDVYQPGFQHYVNHSLFSPDGKYLVFFHVCVRMGVGADAGIKLVRLYAVDILTSKCFKVESERTISHYCWRYNDELLATTRDRVGRWYYTLYNLSDMTRTDLGVPLDCDGHPMFSPIDKDVFVTDTYPDRRRDQHLCVVNLRTGTVEEIATLHSPFRYRGQVRCDLHPRWDRAGKRIIVDTTARGRRELAVIEVPTEERNS